MYIKSIDIYTIAYSISLIKRKDRKCVYLCEIFSSPLKKKIIKCFGIYTYFLKVKVTAFEKSVKRQTVGHI